MPLYDFECNTCHERFEALVTSSEPPTCPACGAADPKRLYSTFAPPAKFGLRGGDARRSDASRRVRDEQLRAGLRKKRERKQQGEG
jgi:putative FmdB family regulatory protein